MNYEELLEKIESKIIELTQSILDEKDTRNWSPRAEERLTALCLARDSINKMVWHNINSEVLRENEKH